MDESVWKTVKSKPERTSLPHQDFSQTVLGKSGASAHPPRTTVKKWGAGKNSHVPSVNMKKLEESNDLPPIVASVPRDISLQIQQGRATKKITQKELATALGIQESMVKNIENSSAPYVLETKDNIRRIARYLGIAIAMH